jgi:flagellar M-ring protein FliF
MSDTPADLPTPLPQVMPEANEASSPPILAALSRFSPGQMIALGVTLAGLLGFFAFIVFRISQPDFSLLYAGLDLEDSAEIVGRLEALGVPYELHGGGEGISVPADQVARMRMTMAEEGLPRGGSVGDEIFDQAGALGTTTFLANVNQRRALEGELGRTISALKDVKAARVHLVLPKRELFRREQIEPSASVTLRMYGGRRLDKRQAAAVQHLVAAAVPGLAPERITLVDDRGTLLLKGGELSLENGLAGQADDYRIAYETRLKHVIEQLLERSLGAGRVHAEVNAEMDFDQVTLTEERFDPDGQVVRSTQSIEEETERAERQDDGAVTVGNNLPNAAADGEGGGSSNNENIVRTEETVNYEISRTVRNHTQVGGDVKRLSVAVLISGRLVPDATGETMVNEELDQQELDEVATLVRSAIGFDAERGDVVEVKNMPFAEPEFEEIETSLFDFTKNDIMRLIELAGLLVLTLIAVFLVIRPAIAKLAPDPMTLDPSSSGVPALTDENGQPMAGAIAAGDGTASSEGDPSSSDSGASSSDDPKSADEEHPGTGLPDLDDPVRMGMIQQAREAIASRPDDAAAIVRHWISQEMGNGNG